MLTHGQTSSLPQSPWLWSPLPPLLVRLGSVPQACWHWSQSVCTDTNNPLSTPARTAQPLSAEADPFVQGETLGDGSKSRRNDLEWRSRELAKQEVDFKEAQRNQFSFLKQIPKQLLCVLSKFVFFPGRLNSSQIYLNHLLLVSRVRIKTWLDFKLIGKMNWCDR